MILEAVEVLFPLVSHITSQNIDHYSYFTVVGLLPQPLSEVEVDLVSIKTSFVL